ncbi:MAG: TetR/AcrR family transcriptional regulator [Cyclobacteriaceae bacterium]|nr:TetR/AcrR family transcriptional regulator [Cyclobacteriaceae bacterium]
MKQTNNAINWIEVGYELFALEGPEGIQVERLSRILHLNKSGFYHYFENRHRYMDCLLSEHVAKAKSLTAEIDLLGNIIPDLLQLLLRYKTTICFHRQLLIHHANPELYKCFNDINSHTDQALLPHWADFIGLPEDHELASRYFGIARDMFYSRITPKTISIQLFEEIVREAQSVVRDLLIKRQL